jgi:hypothetical protein
MLPLLRLPPLLPSPLLLPPPPPLLLSRLLLLLLPLWCACIQC